MEIVSAVLNSCCVLIKFDANIFSVSLGVRAGFARDARTVMLDKGEKLHRRLVNEGRVIQDHRYRLRTYSKSFTGTDFSKWLIEIGEAGDSSEAVRLGQALLENGVIHHGMCISSSILNTIIFYFPSAKFKF